MKTTTFLCTSLILLLVSTGLAAIPGMSGQDPDRNLENYIRETSSQKVYLHLNKNNYTAGEVIWFNAYLVNSVSHLPLKEKTNIYVDLINSQGTIMERRLLLAENGVAEGDIGLPFNLPDGNYRIRAYTGWMKNFSEDFYFNRYLYITNQDYANIIPRAEVRANRRFNRDLGRMAETFEIAFFPEGGNMVQGVDNRVAIKAVDLLGRGIDAEGTIMDDNGNEIVSFRTVHAGMGYFELRPEPGVNYQANVSFLNDRHRNVDLPPAQPEGVALRTERKEDILSVRLHVSGGTHGDFKILAHSRGIVRHMESVRPAAGTAEIAVPLETFPSGITHIVVFSDNGKPVAERLVFIDREDELILNPVISKVEHEGNEYYGIQMEITDSKGNTVEGNFSMSVIEGNFAPPGTGSNLLTDILITSDLDGVIENPQYYLTSGKDMQRELDLLLMTHGWRRFSWDDVLDGKEPELQHMPSSSISIRGNVTDPAKNEPVNNFQVRMKVIGDNNGIYSTTTNNRGDFAFHDLMYNDNFRIEIGSNRLVGDYPPVIDLIGSKVSGFEYTPNVLTREARIVQRGNNWGRDRDAGKSPYAVIPESTRTRQNYGTPDQTIFIDRDKITQRSVLDVLVERAVGLQVQGNRLMFRGPSSLNLSSEPMFMIEGSQVARDMVLSMHPRDVDRIEIFRGPSAAIFGVRGAGGVIAAYVRRAGDMGFQDSKEHMMVGYHSPREFYSDLITARAVIENEEPSGRTIFWNPSLAAGHDEDNTVFFPASEISGQMKIVVEGIGSAGELGTGIFTIQKK